jgi:outer membrane immunogenic protein
MFMKKIVLGMLVSAGLMMSGAAQAADMPLKAQRAAPEYFSWTGFYLGAHVGGAWGTIESEIPLGQGGAVLPFSSHTVNGFVAGGQVGYNYQVNPWLVLGVEGQFSWTDAKGSTPCLVIIKCTTEFNWIATLAGRVGYTFDRTMVYVKAGGAWADADHTADVLGAGVITATSSKTWSGFMVGTGIEYAFMSGWSAKVEYNFMDFDSDRLNFGIDIRGRRVTDVDADLTNKVHLVKFGLNYRFWGGRY